MRIEISPERLAGFGIGISQIADAVKSANVNKDIGFGENGGTSYSVYSGSLSSKTIGDLESLIVGVRRGAPVYLRDVATISQGPGEATNVVEYYTGKGRHSGWSGRNGRAPAVTIAIAKKAGSNGVRLHKTFLIVLKS